MVARILCVHRLLPPTVTAGHHIPHSYPPPDSRHAKNNRRAPQRVRRRRGPEQRVRAVEADVVEHRVAVVVDVVELDAGRVEALAPHAIRKQEKRAVSRLVVWSNRQILMW